MGSGEHGQGSAADSGSNILFGNYGFCVANQAGGKFFHINL
jgi:hypothetical protein